MIKVKTNKMLASIVVDVARFSRPVLSIENEDGTTFDRREFKSLDELEVYVLDLYFDDDIEASLACEIFYKSKELQGNV